MARFEDLEVWKRAARLSTDLYRYFQSSKDYGFRDQMTWSDFSCALHKRALLSLYTNGHKAVPVKCHRDFDRIAADELCRQAGLTPKF